MTRSITLFILLLSGCFSLPAMAQTLNETQGQGAGANITTGDYNTIYGDSAGANLTQGSTHILIGNNAGFTLTNQGISRAPNAPETVTFPSQSNVFIGHGAGYNATGIDNIYIGAFAGLASTSGNDNIAIGSYSGRAITDGFDNTFVGNRSGMRNVGGDDNTFIGDGAGFNNSSASDNTFVGSASGHSNTTGFRNTFIGNEAGYDNTTGFYNTAVGDSAGTDFGAATHNTMIGHAAGAATEWASYNTFVGHRAGWDNNRTNNNTGFNAYGNCYVGGWCGQKNRDGAYNTIMGTLADFEFVGVSTVSSPTNANNYNVGMGYNMRIGGNRNRMIVLGSWAYGGGHQAIVIGDSSRTTGLQAVGIGSKHQVSGNNSIAIGDSAMVTGTQSVAIGTMASVSANNSVAIGNGAVVTANHQVYLGNSAVTSIGGVVNWTATSDARFKTDIEENVIGLDFINRLRPVTYHMDPNRIESHYGRVIPDELQAAAQAKSLVRYTGFLAQEVEDAAHASGYEFSGIDRPVEGRDAYGIRYAEFTVPLVKSVQELSQEVEDLKAELQARDNQIEGMSQLMLKMESRLNRLEAENKAHQEHIQTTKR